MNGTSYHHASFTSIKRFTCRLVQTVWWVPYWNAKVMNTQFAFLRGFNVRRTKPHSPLVMPGSAREKYCSEIFSSGYVTASQLHRYIRYGFVHAPFVVLCRVLVELSTWSQQCMCVDFVAPSTRIFLSKFCSTVATFPFSGRTYESTPSTHSHKTS